MQRPEGEDGLIMMGLSKGDRGWRVWWRCKGNPLNGTGDVDQGDAVVSQVGIGGTDGQVGDHVGSMIVSRIGFDSRANRLYANLCSEPLWLQVVRVPGSDQDRGRPGC